MLFVVPVVTGILLLIAGQSTTALGIEIAVFGLLVGRVLLVLHSAELKDEPGSRVVTDRLRAFARCQRRCLASRHMSLLMGPSCLGT